MPVTDKISDLLTRLRNAGAAKKQNVEVPCSNLKIAIAKILKEEGFISDWEKIDDSIQGTLKMTLRYYRRESSIKEMIRISKPGRRFYTPADKLPRVRNGLGVAIISTSQGVITDKEARKRKIGGEVLCTIW